MQTRRSFGVRLRKRLQETADIPDRAPRVNRAYLRGVPGSLTWGYSNLTDAELWANPESSVTSSVPALALKRGPSLFNCVSLRTIRRAELAERQTTMRVANDLAVRRALEFAASSSLTKTAVV